MDPLVSWIARVALAALFVTAAWHKGRDLAAFDLQIGLYLANTPGMPTWDGQTAVGRFLRSRSGKHGVGREPRAQQ